MENRYYRVSISATHIEDTKLLRKYWSRHICKVRNILCWKHIQRIDKAF
jgi:hypothetical protein